MYNLQFHLNLENNDQLVYIALLLLQKMLLNALESIVKMD